MEGSFGLTKICLLCAQAEDSCGNAQSGEQTITVMDETAPVLYVPGNKLFDCAAHLDKSSDGDAGEATAMDECPASSFSVTQMDDITGNACEEVISRAWTVCIILLLCW